MRRCHDPRVEKINKIKGPGWQIPSGVAGGEFDVISSPDSAPNSGSPRPQITLSFVPPETMPRTRKQESSTEEARNTEPLKQEEEASKEMPTVSEPNVENEESDATVKARERQARFKALQARAVSGSAGQACDPSVNLSFCSRL